MKRTIGADVAAVSGWGLWRPNGVDSECGIITYKTLAQWENEWRTLLREFKDEADWVVAEKPFVWVKEYSRNDSPLIKRIATIVDPFSRIRRLLGMLELICLQEGYQYSEVEIAVWRSAVVGKRYARAKREKAKPAAIQMMNLLTGKVCKEDAAEALCISKHGDMQRQFGQLTPENI